MALVRVSDAMVPDMQSAPTAVESSSAEPNHLLPRQRRGGPEAWAGSSGSAVMIPRSPGTTRGSPA
jgi:hypothetical protein